jgi:hypothetical protein
MNASCVLTVTNIMLCNFSMSSHFIRNVMNTFKAYLHRLYKTQYPNNIMKQQEYKNSNFIIGM